MFKYADYIYEIYKEKSFTKAAKNLFISQPALSATVRKLEEEMQVQLFDRSTSPLSLTPEGEAYIKSVEEIFSIKKDYENYIIDVSQLNVGSISVSGANFISSYVLPKIIVPFSEKYPMINIDLLESNSKTLVEELIDEKIELLIDYNNDQKLIESYPLFEETVLLCVPSSSQVNEKCKEYALSCEDIRNNKYLDDTVKGITLQIFKNEKFLMMKTGNSMNKHGFKLCQEAGFTPDVAIYFDQLMTAYNMTASGLGICFVTDTLVKAVAPNNDLVYYKINSEFAVRTVYLLHKKKRYLNRAVKEFIKTACEVYGTN
ncbi:MAG: LysR family transcriptional regulator [Clostridia bacterium]|nr:LysR family transcriptional regulator [Clostridia bacterium]